jgi:hypothetical protein
VGGLLPQLDKNKLVAMAVRRGNKQFFFIRGGLLVKDGFIGGK